MTTSPAASGAVLLDARGVGKRYGDATVLADVDLALRAGSVHGLIGRNGAGKSTMVGILTGRHGADDGELRRDGRPVSFGSPRAAAAAGVAAVAQEIVLPMDMSVAEVVTLGSEPRRAGFIRRGSERAAVRAVLGSLQLDLDLDTPVRKLPVSWQKVVLVAQTLHRDASVIALDEPTSAMNAEDAARVEQLVHALRDRGVAVLYISHRLDEVERLCDEVTVLRDGRKVATLLGDEIAQQQLMEIMMGEDAATPAAPPASVGAAAADPDAARLRLDAVSVGCLKEFSLDVTPGALIGVAGLPGSGVEEVFGLLAGRLRPTRGTVTVGGRRITSVRSATHNGVSFLPASRRSVILGEEGVVDNMVLACLPACGRASFVTRARARTFVEPVVQRLSLSPVIGRRMGQLSGGNQQRALVGGRLLARPRFLVLEDPTVGVDVAARADLHALLRELAEEGLGCVLGSTDPKELAELCDEVLVVRGGRQVASLRGAEATEYAVTAAMTTAGTHNAAAA
jgi:ABC-type sugar transport system ATPase subunit